MSAPYDAVILAGGQARRLGGADKALLEVGGRPLLEVVLTAVAAADRVVVVGPRRPSAGGASWRREDPPGGEPVSYREDLPRREPMWCREHLPGREPVWCREDPPGGGPVAAIAAGWPHTESPYVAVLATDLPFVTSTTVTRLVAAAQGHDGALLVDERGRDQWLCAVYARDALAARLGGRPASGGAMRSLVEGLDLVRLSDEQGNAFDCDTWDDLARARRREADRAR